MGLLKEERGDRIWELAVKSKGDALHLQSLNSMGGSVWEKFKMSQTSTEDSKYAIEYSSLEFGRKVKNGDMCLRFQ